jgi:O-antigen/teichoic acid export membrane protein
MKEHLANCAFGTLDYIAYPVGMLLLAPAILNVLGIDRFGIWALANAVLMTGAILASGLGDSNIRSVVQARGRRDSDELIVTVRSAFGVHVLLGTGVAAGVWLAAPAITHLTIKSHVELAGDCLWSIRITSGLILLRALETVCVSTQRAFCRYGTAIGVSVTARITSILFAWLVPIFNPRVAAVLVATLVTSCIALSIQMQQLKTLLGNRRLTPNLDLVTTKTLLGFGIFTWTQAVAGLLVGQVDRLAAGFALGTSAVAVYTICVQLTQPIYGISAAGLHFLFPLLASDSASGSHRKLRRSIAVAFTSNFIFVAIGVTSLLIFGDFILRHWVGVTMADAAAGILPVMVCGSALSALAMTGCYALLAIGRPKAIAFLTVAGGVMMAGSLPLLIARFGLAGIAYSRLLPGCATLLVYIPLITQMSRQCMNLDSVDRLSITEET